MAILYEKQGSIFTLQTKNSTYQMKADHYGVLLHTYYGKRTEAFDYSYLLAYGDSGFSGNPYEAGNERNYSLDTLPQEYSCYGTGDFRTSALKVRMANGACALSLRYHSYAITNEKYSIHGLPALYDTESKAQTLKVTLKDVAEEIYVHLYYGVLEENDVITRAVQIENKTDHAIYLERAMSSCLDFIYSKYDMISMYGKHAMERELQRIELHHGRQSVGSTRGASSHQYNPFLILADQKTTEDAGECYGISFLYSGDFLAEVEVDQLNQARVVMGIHPDNFTFHVDAGECFYTPETVLAYSSEGLGALSQIYHKTFRNNLCRGKYKIVRRPVLINNWEGTYFNFTGEKLISMAKDASALGIELFVMDDGWFGKREDDNSGLGDWFVNEKKLGCTLAELAKGINDTGMKFGIWFEPECISEDSDLYRVHPDWAFTIPGRKPMRSRNQLVLDFSREEVRDYIYNRICAILDSAHIEYVKWDYNRSVSDIYSIDLPANRQGEVMHRYMLGLYEVLEKLVTRYPDILFEGCSGGGGRFDAGMLYYTPQIWCSDDTDAIERIKIQYGTSFGYPISAVGSHVSASPNHQTGRKTPLETRAVVAMAGSFGYELDINKMTEEEKKAIKEQIRIFKELESLIHDGSYYRLTNPYKDEAYAVWEFAAESGTEALISIVCTKVYANPAPIVIKCKGLKEEAYYQINGSKEKYLGGALMNGGIPMPKPKEEYESWNLHLQML